MKRVDNRSQAESRHAFGLSGNQLKLLALVCMTCDHVGIHLLPALPILRCIGRLAMPVFAYMIAEGCRYTRNRLRYTLSLAAVALLCQTVYFVAMGSLYQCIMVTFTLSVGLIWMVDLFRRKPGLLTGGAVLLAVGGAWFLTMELPALLPKTDFYIDYRFWGVMLPVLIYLGRDRRERLILTGLGLTALGWQQGGIQWLALLVLPLLALYNGTRGKRKLKYLFYIYYPSHLAAIYLLGLLLRK